MSATVTRSGRVEITLRLGDDAPQLASHEEEADDPVLGHRRVPWSRMPEAERRKVEELSAYLGSFGGPRVVEALEAAFEREWKKVAHLLPRPKAAPSWLWRAWQAFRRKPAREREAELLLSTPNPNPTDAERRARQRAGLLLGRRRRKRGRPRKNGTPR